MLNEHRDYHHRILRALRFVHGDGIGKDNLIEIREIIGHLPAIKDDADLLGFGIDFQDTPDVSIEDFLVVIVFDLHDLVANTKFPRPSRNALPGWIESVLQLDVQIPGADRPFVHGCEHLDVIDRIEAKPLRDPVFDQFDYDLQRLLGIFLLKLGGSLSGQPKLS